MLEETQKKLVELQQQIEALDRKYKEHITGLSLQYTAIATQYSALALQYSLMLARVDALEHPEEKIPDVNAPLTNSEEK